MDMIDAKAKTFQQLWGESHTEDEVKLIQNIREQASSTPATSWTLEQLDQALLGNVESTRATPGLIAEHFQTTLPWLLARPEVSAEDVKGMVSESIRPCHGYWLTLWWVMKTSNA